MKITERDSWQLFKTTQDASYYIHAFRLNEMDSWQLDKTTLVYAIDQPLVCVDEHTITWFFSTDPTGCSVSLPNYFGILYI